MAMLTKGFRTKERMRCTCNNCFAAAEFVAHDTSRICRAAAGVHKNLSVGAGWGAMRCVYYEGSVVITTPSFERDY